MFKRKKMPEVRNAHYEQMWRDMLDAQITLDDRTDKTIARIGVIDLYPEGPDKEAAKRDAEKAKQLLLCAVGHYDSCRAELIRYNEQNPEKVPAGWNPNRFKNSHEEIEIRYEKFFKRG